MAAQDTIRPDYQVARPVAAPNYVGMYSESVRSALEPMNYLLNYQKELSEEDLRKGQIQNFLDDHQDKADALKEEARSHMANEAMTALERQVENRRETELERHDVVDEAHQTRDDALRQQQEDEVARHNQASESQLQRDLDLRTESQKWDIQYKQAQTADVTSQAKERAQVLQDQQSDSDVMGALVDKLKKFSPEQIHQGDPEVSAAIDDAYSQIKTGPGRQRMDEYIGPKTALGREIGERKELNNFSPEAKNAFQDEMLNVPSDSTKSTQERFNDAFDTARITENRFRERQGWGNSGLDAYNQAITDGKSKEEAQAIGRQTNSATAAQEKNTSAVKPEAPNPKMVEQLTTTIKNSMKPNTGEDATAFDARSTREASTKAAQLEEESRTNPAQYRIDVQKLGVPAPGQSTNPADDFARQHLGATDETLKPKPKPTPQAVPDLNMNSSTTVIPPGGATTRLVSNDGNLTLPALTPSGAPNYAASGNTYDLARILNAPYGGLTGETENEEPSETAVV